MELNEKKNIHEPAHISHIGVNKYVWTDLSNNNARTVYALPKLG